MEVFQHSIDLSVLYKERTEMFKQLEKRYLRLKKLLAELRLQEERQRQYEQLVGEAISYPILRDLINSASAGVVIKCIFKDGTSMEIRRDEKKAPDDTFTAQLF